jgi:hypothetical protein
MEINDSVEEISWASKGWLPISMHRLVAGGDASCMSEKIMVTFGVKLKTGKER